MRHFDDIDPDRPETWPASAREYLARCRPPPLDQRLRDALREEIRSRGPIPFARFMERALYEPVHGYYAAAAGRIGAGGDFVTAPTLHPAFGALLCRRIAALWERLGRPDPFIVAEAGANRLAIHQGANDGFRAIYIHCFAGPDRGKGLVVLANGDNRAVAMVARMAQELLRALGIRGIPVGFADPGGACTLGAPGTGAGAIYLNNDRRDIAVVLTALGSVKVHSFEAVGGVWTD